ncbi:hypothetical protein E2K98_04505 [Bacillus salipaludis]|uniref:O-antigen ligase-related domain-containing protein n=2 Tax=Bacillus salipaludis TaxID=2547811 RepID=A0A4R5VXS0_9BACI|nr:hypothetical protein E2K98_04505 [Bacillus salipaludis]
MTKLKGFYKMLKYFFYSIFLVYFSFPLYLENFKKIGVIIHLIILFLLIMILLIKNKNIRKYSNSIVKYLFFLFIYVFIILLTSLFNGVSTDIFYICLYLIFYYGLFGYIVIFMINNIKQIKGLFMYIFIVSFFTGPILGMVQYFRKEMFFNAPYFDSNRLVPINLFDPNYAMLPLIFTLVLNIFFLNNCKKRWNYILLLSTLLTILTAIFLTFSRSGIMVTVVIFLLYFWLFQIYNRIKMSSIFLSLIGIFVAIIIFSYLGIYDSYTNSSRINNVENVDTRVEQWKGALILWENSNLLLGLGKKDYINDLGQITGNFISTHNLYCQVLVQRGLLGILFLFSLIIYILHSLISIRRIAMKNNQLLFNISNILIMGLVGYLIMVFTLSDDIGFYLWFYLGITIALKSLVKKMKLEKQSGDILYD